MTNQTSKASAVRSGAQEPAKHHTDAIMEKYLPPGAAMTDEEWAEHDKRMAALRTDEEARARAAALRNRGKVLTAAGAPDKLTELIVSGGVDKFSQVMADLDAWSRDGRQRICILSGPVGVGKTVAALRWLANFGGMSPCFVRAGDFEARGRYSHKWRDAWQNASGMILDDMGAEYQDAKGNLLADLDTLIDTYAVGRGKLVITTNLPWTSSSEDVVSFQERYEERIASRIIGNATWINVAGPDLRRT